MDKNRLSHEERVACRNWIIAHPNSVRQISRKALAICMTTSLHFNITHGNLRSIFQELERNGYYSKSMFPKTKNVAQTNLLTRIEELEKKQGYLVDLIKDTLRMLNLEFDLQIARSLSQKAKDLL